MKLFVEKRRVGGVLMAGAVISVVLVVLYRAFVLPNNPLLLLVFALGGLLRWRWDHYLLRLSVAAALLGTMVLLPWGLASHLMIHGDLRDHGTWAFPVHIGINMAILGSFLTLELISRPAQGPR